MFITKRVSSREAISIFMMIILIIAVTPLIAKIKLSPEAKKALRNAKLKSGVEKKYLEAHELYNKVLAEAPEHLEALQKNIEVCFELANETGNVLEYYGKAYDMANREIDIYKSKEKLKPNQCRTIWIMPEIRRKRLKRKQQL